MDTFSKETIDEIISRIDSLAEYKEGWNGEGALPILPETIQKANEFVKRAYSTAETLSLVWIKPFITLDVDGFIWIEWVKDERLLYVMIENIEDESVMWQGGNVIGRRTQDHMTQEEWVSLWNWFTGDKSAA